MFDKKIIAVDFDGTLCSNKWPEIGDPNLEVINYIKEQKAAGAEIILWTNRAGKELNEAIAWCNDEQGIIFDAVNANLPWVVKYFGGSDSRKIYATEYIDDKANTMFEFPFEGVIK